MIVLVTEAQPAQLRDLVLALLDMNIGDAGLHVCVEAPLLLDVPVGATLLLRLRTRDSTWLNYTRPIFAERQWRVVLWDEDGAATDIKETAPDFFDWISHVIACPGGVPRFAVRGLQTAPSFPGVVWRGHELERALDAAEPGVGRTTLLLSSSKEEQEATRTAGIDEAAQGPSLPVPYAELLTAARQAPGWLICRGLKYREDLVRLRWALAESGRAARCVQVEPTVDVPGWWPVSDVFASWEEMLHEIGGGDAAAAALVAALLEREPGTGELAGALRQAGVDLDEIAAELRGTADPGAVLARMAHARGLISAEHVIERRAAPAALRGLDHDPAVEDARARRNASVHAALAAWRAGAGRADDWSVTEAELSSWAGAAPADAPALPAARPEHRSSDYWLEATLGREAPSPAARAWARELAFVDVVAHWEQTYGPGESEPATGQEQDATDSEHREAEGSGVPTQRIQHDHARRLAELADLLRERGQLDEAERQARQALDVLEASLGAEHPDVAAALEVLAQVLSSEGRYNEAVNVLRRAIAISERMLGPAHPATESRRQALTPLAARIQERYRISIVYASADEPWVKGYLIPALGIDHAEVRLTSKTWLDTPLTRDIEVAVAQSQYILVVLSKAWETDEWAQYAISLSEQLSMTGRGRFALRCTLEDCNVPPSVKTLREIDCRDYAQRSEGTERQTEKDLATLRKILDLATPPVEERIRCPYPGMEPVKDREFFFGREDEIQRLLKRVRGGKLTVVVGPSGSGKSSLIQAGLIPRVPDTWLIRQVRLLDGSSARLGQELGIGVEVDAPLSDPSPTIEALFAGRPQDARVLVIVDPLEELFQLAPADKDEVQREQKRFRKLLEALAREPRWACVLALRADFYANLLSSPVWSLLEEGILPIRQLSGDALRAAIREPAARQGVWIEPALIEQIIADADDEPGFLPLAQETLRWLWEERERRGLRRLLPRSLYAARREADGGNPLAAILAREAEAALEELSEEENALVQPLLLRLVHFGEDGRYTRRQQRLADLTDIGNAGRVRRVIDHLARNRLLTLTGGDDTASAHVDLAHEAIIAAWPRLARWIETWREDEQRRRRLEDRAREWVEREREGGLLDAVALKEAEEWLDGANAQRLGISDELRDLIAASRAVIRRRRGLAVFVLIFFMFAMSAGISAMGALQQQSEAESTLNRALEAIEESRASAQKIVSIADKELKPIAGTERTRERLLYLANDLLEHLLSQDTRNVEATHNPGARYILRADVALSKDNRAQAREYYQRALDVTQTLVAIDPENAVWQKDLALTYAKLGNIEIAAGDLHAARSCFRNGLDIARKLAAADPGNTERQRDLLLFYERLGDFEFEAGDLDAARSNFRGGLNIARELVKADPKDAMWQRDLAASYESLGDVELRAGNLDAARTYFRDKLEHCKELAQESPDNTWWQSDLALSYERLGNVELAAGKLDAGRSYLLDGLNIRKALADAHLDDAESRPDRKLVTGDPDHAKWQRDLAISYERLGHVELDAGKLDAARTYFLEGLNIHKRLADARPDNAEWQRDLIASEMKLADLEAQAQKPAVARRYLEAAKDVLERLDTARLLRGDALLEQYRQAMLDFERQLPP